MRRRGARSIRGALGTYAAVSAAAVLLLGLVLWLGPRGDEDVARVGLAADGAFVGAVLDSRQGSSTRGVELEPGALVEVIPGLYRATLFDRSGAAVVRELDLGPGDHWVR